MQKVAAIRTVSWISRSVAPAARASAICSVVTLSPLCWTAAAIANKVFSLADTGALLASARTCSTSAMPPGSWAAADAECDDEQYRQSFSADTYAAISSRSPRVSVPGPRSSTSASSLSGRPVSGRYRSSPRIPGSAEFNAMFGIRSPGPCPHPSDGDDDLAAGAALEDVADGRRGLAKRVGPVDGGGELS